MQKTQDRVENILTSYLCEIERTTEKENIQIPKVDYIGNLNNEDIRNALQSITWGFADNNTTYLSHDIHPYPAKFIPQLPESLIKSFSKYGDMIWDPFGGSGTTALEALLCNRQAISTDINPIGELIGNAKTATLTENDERDIEHFIKLISRYASNEQYFRDYVANHRKEISTQIPAIPNLSKWFSTIVVCELGFIKYQILITLRSETAKIIAKASLSKLITRVSNQDSETRYSAKDKKIPSLQTLKYYTKYLNENFVKSKALSKVLGRKKARFVTQNVAEDIVGPKGIIRESEIDLIVTSPPYPNAFDYHLYHRFRIFWLDGDPRVVGKNEIGSHLKYQRGRKGFEEFENEMFPVLVNSYKALKDGRFAIFILGDAIFDSVLYKTAERVGLLAKSVGFEIVCIVDRPIHETKRTVQSAVRRAEYEQLLVLKKPDRSQNISMRPVSYRMWPYEKVISNLEQSMFFEPDDSNSTILSSQSIDKLKKLTFYSGYEIGSTYLRTWQSILENGNMMDAATRKEPKYVTHGIHPYKGKFYPQLVRPLLNILQIPEGGIVLDPFCGSGTVLLEAALNGYHAYGCDINPIAVEIARTKNEIIFVEPYEFDRQLSAFESNMSYYNEAEDYSEAFMSDSITEIRSWFPAPVVNKMGFILQKTLNIPDDKIQRFVRVSLSSIIREISQQDPSDLRIRRRANPITDAPVIEMLSQSIATQKKRILKFAEIRNLAPSPLYEAFAWHGNSKSASLLERFSPNSIDLVITSPPYATALPYIDTNRLNMLVLNGLTAALRIPLEAEMTGTREIKKSLRKHYDDLIASQDYGNIISETAKLILTQIYICNCSDNVGFRKKNMAALLYMYFNDMSDVFRNLNTIVKHGGHICIVIGDTKTTTCQGLVAITTTKVMRETGRALGWELSHDIPITVTKDSYKHIGNAIVENNILVFTKR